MQVGAAARVEHLYRLEDARHARHVEETPAHVVRVPVCKHNTVLFKKQLVVIEVTPSPAEYSRVSNTMSRMKGFFFSFSRPKVSTSPYGNSFPRRSTWNYMHHDSCNELTAKCFEGQQERQRREHRGCKRW